MTNKVEILKQQIQNGTYKIQPDKIAAKLMESGLFSDLMGEDSLLSRMVYSFENGDLKSVSDNYIEFEATRTNIRAEGRYLIRAMYGATIAPKDNCSELEKLAQSETFSVDAVRTEENKTTYGRVLKTVAKVAKKCGREDLSKVYSGIASELF